MFRSLLSYDIKQRPVTTTTYSKHTMELLQNRKALTTKKVLYGRVHMDVMGNKYGKLHYIYYQCCLMIVVLDQMHMVNLFYIF